MGDTLGQRLRELRLQRGQRMLDVAEVAGISVSWVNDMEHDRNTPSLDTLVRLATALETSVVDLLQGIAPYDKQ